MLVGPGEQYVVEWLMGSDNRGTRRMPLISVTATDDLHAQHICSRVLPIAALDKQLLGALIVDPPVLRCSPDPPYVAPTEFTVTASLSNTGGLNLDDVWAELRWTDLSGLDLIRLDPAYPDNSNPKTRTVLFPGTAVDFSWGFRLKNPNLSSVPHKVRFMVLYGSRSTDTSFRESMLTIDPRPPAASITALRPTTFCAGDSTILDAGAGYAAYFWNTGDTTRFITGRQSGQYHVLVTLPDSSACQARSDTVQVTVLPLPPIPVITQNANALTTDPAAAWQWFLGGRAIPGATQQSHTAVANGWYRVVVQNAEGCERSSDSLFVTLTGIDRIPPVPERLTVFPNPSTGSVTVDLAATSLHGAVIRVADVLGREVYRGTAPKGVRLHRIDLSTREPGMYFIIAEGSDLRMSATIVIDRD
ncbi:MAG: hypothetical protein C0600_11245 [Ignavibacteria bacterium]|nr:MAG: hypothetical protein C0600_11245 [Ignavibacteria bacterium]